MREDDGEIRVTKLIASRGVASRREAEKMIAEGRVSVNGEVIRETVPVDPHRDVVKIDGRNMPRAPEKIYYLLYKPRGYITGRDDPEGRRNVLELVEDLKVRMEPVGRLDYDTEGALLLTNDGALANKLAHPSTDVPKRYAAKVYRCPTPEKLEAIRLGKVHLDDGPAKPAKCRVIESTDKENSWVEITVTEGRNRLIRRIFEQLRHPVSKLRRESFATLSIRGMERGQVRRLTADEVQRVREMADGKKASKTGQKRYGKGFARPKPKGRPQNRKNREKRKGKGS